MTFSFKYKPERLSSGAILHRPLIPITLEGKEKIDVFSILDSGSDMSIIPKEIAEVLEIKTIKENEVSGITGSAIWAREGKLRIHFGKGHEGYSFEIPVLIPEKENLSAIIGRAGFFNQFKITFIESDKRIEFKKENL